MIMIKPFTFEIVQDLLIMNVLAKSETLAGSVLKDCPVVLKVGNLKDVCTTFLCQLCCSGTLRGKISKDSVSH